ncbi:hypothetical protein ACHQM5_001886 [Ranunculus cassubicifolius]
MNHVLHRSFKPAKCKTSLKLAVARLKLLKNKREVQVRSMKRDLAHLLETGQEKTAMIRVEHVVREEKTMAAYDFIDIYCELIVARLPIIESQKTCPIDLKEAVSSLVFVSPRCADIPELEDVRKQFTAKYGKEFITSALELRPNCGVNRTVVENLSARTPDGQTKLKILSEIAKEHNIEWDPKAFGEKELQPPDDLLNGPKVNEVTTSGGKAETLPTHLPSYGGRPEPTNAAETTGSSWNSHTPDPTHVKNPNMMNKTSGNAVEGRDSAHQGSQNTDQYYPNRQNWNMEFKDATSAAQAAAESAERASFAARAAAELSTYGKFSGQYSRESHDQMMQDQQRYRNERENAGVSGSSLEKEDGRRNNHSASSAGSGKFSREPSMQEQKLHRDERHSTQGTFDSAVETEDSTRRKNKRSTSSLSHRSDIEDDLERKDIYHNKHSSEESKIQSSHFDEQINRPGHTDSMKERITRQPSRSSSSFSDDNGDIMQSSTNDNPPIVFDEYVWDDESTGHKEVSYDSPPRTKSPPQFSESSSIWSPRRDKAETSFPSEFSTRKNETSSHTWSPEQNSGGSLEKSSSGNSNLFTDSKTASVLFERENKASSPSQSIDLPPVTFDESDGVESEIEEEVDNAKSPEPTRHASSFPIKDAHVPFRKPSSYVSSDDSDSDNTYPNRNQGRQGSVRVESLKKDKPYSPVIEEKQPSIRSSRYSLNRDRKNSDDFDTPLSQNKVEDSELPRDFSSGSEEELDLGGLRLRGGLRNKGYKRPPYRKDTPQQTKEDTSEQSKVPHQPSIYEDTSSRYSRTTFASDNDDTEGIKSQSSGSRVHKATSSRTSRTTFAPENVDTERLERQSSGSRVHKDTSPRTSRTTFVSENVDTERLEHQSSGSRVKQLSRPEKSRRSFRTNGSAEQKPVPPVQSWHEEIPESTRRTERPLREEKSEPSRYSETKRPERVPREEKLESSQPQPLREEKSQPSRYSETKRPERVLREEKLESSQPLREEKSQPSRYSETKRPERVLREEKLESSQPLREEKSQPSRYSETKRPERVPREEKLESSQPLREEKSLPSRYSETKRPERVSREEKLESSQSLPVAPEKKPSLDKESMSRENSHKNPGHVHPKLPDYDSFAAHFQSLRSNR